MGLGLLPNLAAAASNVMSETTSMNPASETAPPAPRAFVQKFSKYWMNIPAERKFLAIDDTIVCSKNYAEYKGYPGFGPIDSEWKVIEILEDDGYRNKSIKVEAQDVDGGPILPVRTITFPCNADAWRFFHKKIRRRLA